MTDARHDSTSNAFHSTVVFLSGRLVTIPIILTMNHNHFLSISLVTRRSLEFVQSPGRSIQLPKLVSSSVLKNFYLKL